MKLASVEWRSPPTGEALRYLQVARQVLQENIADVEEGNEQLFLQDVQNIKIAVDNQTLVITFSLAGNYSDRFITDNGWVTNSQVLNEQKLNSEVEANLVEV